jgi:hypothetical protein
MDDKPPRKLPNRAYKLARRVLASEANNNGRGRFMIEIVMVDGLWFLTESKPVKWETLED